jgi:succinate-semialdehyde dehydrogenase / glutarate-semialdehyde dehydrogenase
MIELRNPRTGAIDARLQPDDTAELIKTSNTLRDKQRQWQSRPATERATILLQLADLLAVDVSVCDALVVDTGRRAVSDLELSSTINLIRRWATQAPEILAHKSAGQSALPSIRFESTGVPFALVAVISPWNFPLLLSMIDTIPALLAGCAAWVKPSEVACRFVAPLTTLIARIPELAQVLRFEIGAADTGTQMIQRADALCFTGSVTTGRKVYEACAKRFIPAFLELGGKDPLIVLPDADLDIASDIALRSSVIATGQACQSIERIYVHATQHSEFIRLLTEKAERLSLTFPDPRQGQIGPLIFAKQGETIAAQLNDARAKGAIIHTGGVLEDHGGGLWIRPTVVSQVDHQMQLMREETFGPIMPVMAYQSIEEAITLANDSEFGLSASVVGTDLKICEQVALQLDVGAVSINDAALTSLVYEAEKQAFRLSGLGASRMGSMGVLRFLRRRALIWQTGAPLPLGMMDER